MWYDREIMCFFLCKCSLNKFGCCIFFTLLCFSSTVLCNATEPDRPDITMLYKKDTKVCVAGSNTEGFGLAFMSKNISDNVYVDNFEYRDENGNLIDTADNCDFEERHDCIGNWLRNSVRVNIQFSNKDPIAPVTDERWNNFEVFRSDEQKDKKYNIRNNFFISISIRASQNAEILFCATSDPKLDSCYWIIIDGFKNNEVTALRKCTFGLSANDSICGSFVATINIPGKLLNESKWTHFMLSRERSNQINLWLWDIQGGARSLLKYTDGHPLPISFMFLRSTNSIADWKIHNYNYLTIGSFINRPTNFRSLLNFASSSVCVSLYVAMCKTCKAKIKLQNEFDFDVGSSIIEGNPDEEFMTWRNIKIQNNINSSLISSYRNYSLVVELTDSFHFNEFWAIDDIRKCARNEIRVARINTTKEIQCQSLKDPYWTFNTNKQTNSSEPPICRDGRYIGLHCNISCSVIPDGCTEQKICLPIQKESDKGACTCAAGNLWTKYGCAKKCVNHYGFNCQNECGKCRNSTCNRVTGECELGCEYNEFLPPFCKLPLPRLGSPPIILNISYTSVTVRYNDVKINSSIPDMVHSILLECKKENQKWYNCTGPILYTKLENQSIVITSLEKETLYFIRGVVYTNNGYAYTNDDLPMSNFTTTCRYNRIVTIYINSWNATIHFQHSNTSCHFRNNIVQLKRNDTTILRQYASQNMVLSNLQPYTIYEVVVTKKGDKQYRDARKFKTKAAEPPAVKNFTAYSKSTTFISLRWLDPYPPQGQLESYFIEYCQSNSTNGSCSEVNVTTAKVVSCDLWNENYKCYKLQHIFGNIIYKINIKAKNKDIKSYGPESEISVRTEEEKSSAPLNLTEEWTNKEMYLNWNHPNITNGLVQKFIIAFEQKDTPFIDQIANKSNNICEYMIKEEMKDYHYTVPISYLFSSTYAVSVCAVNKFYGENATIIIDTPPETPELDGDLIVESEKITDTSVILVIPAIKENTKRQNSFLYVVVNNQWNKMTNQEKGLKQLILQQAGLTNSAIVIEKKLSDKEISVLVGDGSEAYSANLQEYLHNKHLKSGTDYNITIVLMNQYKKKISLNSYTIGMKTRSLFSSSSELYALFLLLLLPLAGYFIYRYRKKKLASSSFIEPTILVRNDRFELIANPPNSENNNQGSSNYDYIEPNVPVQHNPMVIENGTNAQSNNAVPLIYDYVEPILQRHSYLEIIADDANTDSNANIAPDEHTYESVDYVERQRTYPNVPLNDHTYVNSPTYVNT